MITTLLIGILAPLVLGPALLLISPKLKSNLGWLALFIPLISILAIVKVGLSVYSNHVINAMTLSMDWVPSLGINFSFLVDGVSLFFGLVVSIMGLLVVLYSKYYLHETVQDNGRFYCYLMLFMSAMLGTVFANNLIVLLVFWEFTGITSFLLIGFSHEKKDSRRGALMAFITTGFTGLLLLAGLILLTILFETSDFSKIVSLIGNNSLATIFSASQLPYLKAAMALILIGAFGKSAQFPFQYWLPNAMAAPTPVSAYLHSAAMVKLGIFLTVRMYPVFKTLSGWNETLLWVGFITMTIGGIFSFLSNDLKGILAYTTVSQLGFLIGFYGLGTLGLEHDFFQILNHVFYKGSLFMVAGIIIHSIGTKDIRKIGGLASVMPLTAITATIAGLSMAGIPGTMGFVSKEIMVSKVLELVTVNGGGIYWLFPACLFISAMCLIATSLRFIYHCFYRKIQDSTLSIHKPKLMFQLPPFMLSLGALFLGLFPETGGHLLNQLNSGIHHVSPSHLAIFHGINEPLLFGLSIITTGFILFAVAQAVNWRFTGIPKSLLFETHFLSLISGIKLLGKEIGEKLHVDKQQNYLTIIISFFVIAFWYLGFNTILSTVLPIFNLDYLEQDTLHFIHLIAGSLLAISSICIIAARRTISKFISLSVTGFLVGFYFMLYKAPDLALTQMLIEAAALALVLILFSKMPKTLNKPIESVDYLSSGFKLIISIGFGAMMTSLILVSTLPSSFKHMGKYFIDNTLSLAKGSNAVNTILVDFRGFDTMGEITVLVVATLGILGMLATKNKKIGASDD
ncbi:DUF4040 domain-containing protein [bacterium]|jgi:NADH:ubiquinone oxidoreductase subunit 5 (subunit L)/multisubunit Na+/H+ antiporter MnhA subunit/uncharacterized MnhB-related membrane protein|nr:DUF4040 domain-containing protein [bacterium]